MAHQYRANNNLLKGIQFYHFRNWIILKNNNLKTKRECSNHVWVILQCTKKSQRIKDTSNSLRKNSLSYFRLELIIRLAKIINLILISLLIIIILSNHPRINLFLHMILNTKKKMRAATKWILLNSQAIRIADKLNIKNSKNWLRNLHCY